MHFHSALIKLTSFYVAIVMIISVSFSVALFNISSNELGRGFDRQARFLRDMPVRNSAPFSTPDFEQLRLDQLKESNNHLKNNLVIFNLLILLISSWLAYLFAKKTLKPIEEAMESQNRFTADASHELRTPLTAMKTEVEVALRDKKLSLADAKELLKSNLEEIGKLEALSGALLKLARDKDDPKKSFKEVSLEEVLAESYQKVECLSNKKSIEINCHFEPVPMASAAKPNISRPTGTSILGDAQSLIELFVIFLDNAIKYSPEKSKITINVRENKDQAIVKIKDSGIGIKASDLPFIFNRFYRADRSRSKENVEGYGLGLSIAKQIIDLHNGTVSVHSEPGKGTEFVIGFKHLNPKTSS